MEQLFDTPMTDLVTQSLRALPAVGGMAVITGPNGIGKSWSVRAAQRDVARIQVVNPTPPPPGGGTPRAFYRDVAARMGLDVPGQAGALDLVVAIVREVRERGYLLVIDHAEGLAQRQMEYVRHLVDEVGHLAIVGGPALRMKIVANAALAVRTRLPIELLPLGLMDVQRAYGHEFAPDALRAMHEQSGGLWSGLATLVTMAHQIARQRQMPSLAFTADDVAVTAEKFLLARPAALAA